MAYYCSFDLHFPNDYCISLVLNAAFIVVSVILEFVTLLSVAWVGEKRKTNFFTLFESLQGLFTSIISLVYSVTLEIGQGFFLFLWMRKVTVVKAFSKVVCKADK